MRQFERTRRAGVGSPFTADLRSRPLTARPAQRSHQAEFETRQRERIMRGRAETRPACLAIVQHAAMTVADDFSTQRVHEVQNVAAVIAAEDAVFVLDGYQAYAAIVYELRRARIIRLHVLADLELHLSGILMLAERFSDGQDHVSRAAVGSANCRRKVSGKRSNPTPARRVRSHERNRDFAAYFPHSQLKRIGMRLGIHSFSAITYAFGTAH